MVSSLATLASNRAALPPFRHCPAGDLLNLGHGAPPPCWLDGYSTLPFLIWTRLLLLLHPIGSSILALVSAPPPAFWWGDTFSKRPDGVTGLLPLGFLAGVACGSRQAVMKGRFSGPSRPSPRCRRCSVYGLLLRAVPQSRNRGDDGRMIKDKLVPGRSCQEASVSLLLHSSSQAPSFAWLNQPTFVLFLQHEVILFFVHILFCGRATFIHYLSFAKDFHPDQHQEPRRLEH